METRSIMIVGVGGQGSLLASRLLGNVLLAKGFDVKVSEVHGMSQRGGSVVTYVKFGDKVYSPIVDNGEADIILAFELLEAIRKTDADGHSGIFYSNSGFNDPPEWDYRNYDIKADNCLLKGIIDRIRDGYENYGHNI